MIVSKVQPAKRRSRARTCRFRSWTTAFRASNDSCACYIRLGRELLRPVNSDSMRMSGTLDVASAACVYKPGSSRRRQSAIILRLRSAVRGCRRDAIGFSSHAYAHSTQVCHPRSCRSYAGDRTLGTCGHSPCLSGPTSTASCESDEHSQPLTQSSGTSMSQPRLFAQCPFAMQLDASKDLVIGSFMIRETSLPILTFNLVA